MKNNSMKAYFGSSNYDSSLRIGGDYYATDPKAIDYLLQHEQFAPRIWECAVGGGEFSNQVARTRI